MISIHVPSTTRRFRLARTCAVLMLASILGSGLARSADACDLPVAPVQVTMQDSGSVEGLPSGRTQNGLAGAHYVDVGPAGKLMLVSSKDKPVAWLLDACSGRKLATFDIGPVPQGVGISPDGRRGLAVSAGNGTVAVIDMRKRRMIRTIAVGKVPHNVRFTADGRRAYVTLQGGGAVAVVDMRTLEKVGEIPVPGIQGPHNLDLSADGKILWVRDLVGKVAALDLRTGKELALIPVGLGHAGIDVIPGGRYVFTGAIADHEVDVIDPRSFKVVKRIDVGQGPHGVRASQDGRLVYVAVTGTDKVAVIDTRTLEVVRQIPVHGRLPFWVAVVGND